MQRFKLLSFRTFSVQETKRKLILIGLCFVAIVLLSVFRIGCPLRFITGITCMGCGMTRAVTSLFQMKFADAFYYHPCVFLIPFFCCYSFCSKAVQKHIIVAGTIVFVLIYLCRLYHGNAIVEWHLEEGLIYKILFNRGQIC